MSPTLTPLDFALGLALATAVMAAALWLFVKMIGLPPRQKPPKPPEPYMNEGGGWEWPDGRITRDREGRGPDLRIGKNS